MLYKINLHVNDRKAVIDLEGVLDGSIDFREILSKEPAELAVYSSKVLHLNSSVVAKWLPFFHDLVARKTAVSFHECAIPLVEYFNLIPNFACGGTILSVMAPFFCARCNADSQVCIPIDQLDESFSVLTRQHCRSCRAQLQFEDEPEEYFRFLTAG